MRTLLLSALAAIPPTLFCSPLSSPPLFRPSTPATPPLSPQSLTSDSYGPGYSSGPSFGPGPPPGSPTKVAYAGINIPGYEFGCTSDGYCPLSSSFLPGRQGQVQLSHFIGTDNLTAFRFPVSWQYLVNNKLSGPLGNDTFTSYNALVQGCVNRGGKFCVIDVHNYGRWNGQIVGQSYGVKDDDLVNLWTQLAQSYKSTPQVAFGIMNEPHNLSFDRWVQTLQTVVTAIRNTGATENPILLPGSDWCAAGGLLDGDDAALAGIKNPDGTTTGLVLDIHVYLDSDNTGTHEVCTSDMIREALQPLGWWLRVKGRTAFVSETGGSSDASCIKYFCNMLQFLNQNADVYLGYTTWGAGSFSTNYVYSDTPFNATNGTMVDQPLVQKCILPNY